MLYYFDVMFTLCERSVDVNLKLNLSDEYLYIQKGLVGRKG